jgi:hypothetical protein
VTCRRLLLAPQRRDRFAADYDVLKKRFPTREIGFTSS